MVAGWFDDFRKAIPLLQAVGRNIWLKKEQEGSMMKLANNTVVVLNMMAFIEGVEIAVSSGID